MSLYRRQDSPYWWMLLEGTGLKMSTRVPVDAYTTEARKQQRQAADEIYRARMTDAARGRHDLPLPAAEGVGFEAFSRWYQQHHTSRKRGREREAYALKQLRQYLGARALTDITRGTIQEYITTRVQDVSASTANREVDVLKSILREAVNAGHLKASPLAGLKRLRHIPPRKTVLNQRDEDRLLAQLPPADQALYIVAVDTLMRLSNVLNLRRRNDKGRHLELEDSKTGPYSVPLSTRARKALDSLPKKGEYIFWHRRGAKTDRDRRGALRRMLERACARCRPKIPYGRAVAGVTFHLATRATGATRMLRAGVDPRTVQAVGHWSSFEQMGAYLQADEKTMRRAVNTIGAKSTVRITPQLRKGASRRFSSRKSA